MGRLVDSARRIQSLFASWTRVGVSRRNIKNKKHEIRKIRQHGVVVKLCSKLYYYSSKFLIHTHRYSQVGCCEVSLTNIRSARHESVHVVK